MSAINIRVLWAIVLSSFACGGNVFAQATEPAPKLRLSQWARGLSVDSTEARAMRMYFWFYEWHMFDAVTPGQHSLGTWENRITLAEDGMSGTIVSANPGLSVEVRIVDDGAEMTLTVTNLSDHDWPELASIIACFNPGPEATRTRQFGNTNTYFSSAEGLKPLAMQAPREIHYNDRLLTKIEAEADDRGRYVWSKKWPKSAVTAVDGLIIRESSDGQWVTGVAWERFLSAQGHNPWECMHLSTRLGPLKQGETRSIRGKVYLFRGDRNELVERYQRDFNKQ